MEITETRVKLVGNRNDRLKAFCSITFDDDFVIRDLKIIEGTSGFFVAMPSRKLTDRCPSCGSKNHLRAHYCNECGDQLSDNRAGQDDNRATKLHADIAHPVNTETRQFIQDRVVIDFKEEVERSKEPGYQPPRLDDDDEYHRESSSPAETEKAEPVTEADIPNDRSPVQEAESETDALNDSPPIEENDTASKFESDSEKQGDDDNAFGKGIFG